MKTTNLKITGMMCDACIEHVDKALTAVPGVVQAGVDLETGRATVQHEDADEQALIAAITEAGYQCEIAE
ncbi:MAG: heavy-metal-associated domain-containing protein [Armatimonadota bacterium]|nr:heavy-metal-associated domain-containing protein [Armatimonadota bacterium]